MADTKRGRLGVGALVKETNTAVYEVTNAMDSKVMIFIVNTGSNIAKVNIAVVDGGAGDIADEDYIIKKTEIAQNDYLFLTDIEMNADEAVVAYSDQSGVVVRVGGIEQDESGSSVLPSVQKVVSGALAVADFTDNTDATGYIDFANDLPAGAIPLGWKVVTSGAFAGDTSAVISIGIAGDLDRFTSDATQSCFTAITTGNAGVAADGGTGIAAAQTPRVTVTGASDFGLIVTDGNGAMTVELYYLATV